jgi:serine/threonine protein kinase
MLLSLALCRVTEKGNYSEEDSRRLIKQILNGVSYLHSHGKVLASLGASH